MAREQRNALPKGYVLDEYTIERVLGAGGFGITYLALEEKLGRRVAIKEYLPTSLAMRDTDGKSVHPVSSEDKDDYDYGLDRFRDEARTLVNFHHPNIVTVHRFLETNSTAYLVMQYVEGDSLYDILLRDKQLPEHELLEILLPLLDGLEKVHAAGFLHRDIKPANIFIQTDGTPVLLDFGAARQALGDKSQSMTSIATPGYAPFEQYASRGRQGAWTDLYAMGATLYRAVTGAKPTDAPDRIAGEELVPAVEAGKGRYSTGFLKAIDWALNMKASERPQSVDAWRGVLSQVASETIYVHRPRRPAGRRFGLGIAATVVVLAAAGAGAWVALVPSEEAVRVERIRAEAQTRRVAEEKRAAVKAEARRKAEEDAKRKAVSEARKKAKEEAMQRIADDKARRRAKEIAKQKAIDEAKRKAAAEAKEKALEEARRKVAEAKRVAADKAKSKARLDARKKVEDARRAAAKKGAVVASGGAKPPKTPGQARLEALEKRIREAEKRTAAAERRAKNGGGTQTATAGAAGAGRSQALKAIFSGATIYFKSEYDVSYAVDFREGGTLLGNKAVQGPDLRQPPSLYSDTGVWSVRGNRLCIKWNRWDKGEALCYAIKGGRNLYTADGAKGILTGRFRLSK